VRAFQRDGRACGIELTDGPSIPVSRRLVAEVRRALG
jgi:hypothetical protein